MKSFNGNRLKTARQYRGLTVEELAQKIDVSKQAVSQYETGRIEDVPFQRILSISNALNFPYKYFAQEDISRLKTGATFFRSLMKTSKKYRLAQEIKMEHIAVIYSCLNEYIDFPILSYKDCFEIIGLPVLLYGFIKPLNKKSCREPVAQQTILTYNSNGHKAVLGRLAGCRV